MSDSYTKQWWMHPTLWQLVHRYLFRHTQERDNISYGLPGWRCECGKTWARLA